MKSTVFLMYKLFDNRISKRFSTPIVNKFLCENVTVTYTAKRAGEGGKNPQ